MKLSEILSMHDRDCERALTGVLSGHMLHHRISIQRWSDMSVAERNKRVFCVR